MASSTTYYSFNLPAVGGDSDAWGTLLNSNWSTLDDVLNGDGTAINLDGYTIDDLTLTNVSSIAIDGEITENVYAHTATSGTIDIDPANGSIQTVSVDGGDVTFTESLSAGQFVTLSISSVGTDSVAWPTMQWMYGIEPTLDADNTNWIQIWKVGTTVYGSYLGYSS